MFQLTSTQMSFAVEKAENREVLLQRLQMAAQCLDQTCTDVECSLVSFRVFPWSNGKVIVALDTANVVFGSLAN